MPKWTDNQNNAIEARGRNILVSAAAGSGKTAVLVERVIRIITDKSKPVDIDKLLIVTFTNAAAAEMKSRISRSLKNILKENPDDKNARRQLSLLPMSKICTIDSFCINLVRENFFQLGINQDFTNFDESELQLLEEQVINEVLDEYFTENDDEAFIKVIEAFTTQKSDKNLISSIKRILRFIYAQPFPYKWLSDRIEYYNPDCNFDKTIWVKYLKNEINYLLSYAVELVNESKQTLTENESAELAQKLLDNLNDDKRIIKKVRDALNVSWDNLYSLDNIKFSNLARTTKLQPDVADKIKGNRDIYKKIIYTEIPALMVSSSEEYFEDMAQLYPQLLKLFEIVQRVDNRLLEEKKERNSYSFSDIEHFAIDLMFKLNGDRVEKTELGKKLSDEYYEILVDEYQDTNEAQDMLFTYLSNGKNLFTVGDVKQSIYRFRLAMPQIFNAKRNSYKYYDKADNADSSKIILDKNFRSRSGICSYVNFVFSALMSERIGELSYNEDECLNNGAQFEPTDIPCAQIFVLNNVKGELSAKKEATLIAKEILRKIESREQIKDKETEKPRDIRFGDFAIFMRSLKSHISEYSQVLTSYGIPVICDNSTNLFDNSEIKLIINLLRAIDNPTMEIPLLSTMLSPIYSFTPDEVAKIRVENNHKSFFFSVVNSKEQRVVDFLNELKELKRLSVTMSVASFIRYLIEEKCIVAISNAYGNGEQRYQNIAQLISFATTFDKGSSVGMTSFLRFVDKLIASDNSVSSAALTGSQDNAVKIMSIHHSKGLEFPVCILAGASRQYNKSDLSQQILLNTELGLGLKCHNEERLYQYQSLPYCAIKNKNSIELMSENLRVLYVALTRAKEQFITFACCENIDTKIDKLSKCISKGKINPYSVQKTNNDADLLLMCALLHPNCGELRRLAAVNTITEPADFSMRVKIVDEVELLENDETIDFVPAEKDIVESIDKKLSFAYERTGLSTLSSKLTASSLDEVESNYDYLTSAKPAFMSSKELTPAERGTAMHTFMQYCDYKKAADCIDDEIKRLTENRLITAEQAYCLDKTRLLKFLKSDIANRINSADEFFREFKVTSFLTANEIYDTQFNDKVLVQGIADCVFVENGEIVIVDFKTDRVGNESELLDRYKRQISFYSTAVSRALNKPVKQAMLYSFYLGKACYY